MGYLVHNLLLFVRLLRAASVAADPERVQLCARAIERLGVERRSDLYLATRATLVVRQQDLAAFDRLFEAFWRRFPKTPSLARRRRAELLAAVAAESPEAGAARGKGSYSYRERLRRKDFGEMDQAELALIKRMIADLSWRLGARRARRLRPGPGRLPDHRRSWRANLRYGGELLARMYRRRKQKPRPLVVLADVSGSMERYSELLLYFTHSLVRRLEQPVEVFVFSTRLSRITRQLRTRRPSRAGRAVSEAVHDWSGGTRIGEAIKEFNFRWARRTLARGAVVALISDGLDRGPAGLLAHEMARLQRSCSHLIWLNPLLGSADYRPLARGMQSALPHVDEFLPVHNLQSLEQLAVRI